MRGISSARAAIAVALAGCVLPAGAMATPAVKQWATSTAGAMARPAVKRWAAVAPASQLSRRRRARIQRHHASPRLLGSTTSAPDVLVNLYDPGFTSHYAFVEEAITVRSHPWSSAGFVAKLKVGTFWETSEIVQALEQTAADGGWTLVRVPAPHEPVGWVPTTALSPLAVVHTWLQVNRESLIATLVKEGKVVFSAPIGVGKPSTPTPEGEFFIEESLTPLQLNGFYGPFAFGTSAHSATLTEWPNKGQVGVHGTNEPELIPGRVSHGCIRMLNADILRLSKLMPVGTPVTIY